MLDPMMIMYDEPFTGLDPITKGTIVTLIKQLNDALGLTSIMVSHDVEETMSISDYVFVLDQGKIAQIGRHEELIGQDGVYRRIHDMQTQIEDALEKELADV